MDTLNKVLHPKQTPHRTDDDTDLAGTQTARPSNPEDPRRPNQETQEALTAEPNVTGTDRPAPREEFPSNIAATEQGQEQEQQHEPQAARRGHHHPRQPVGATGLPPNHRPAEECNPEA